MVWQDTFTGPVKVFLLLLLASGFSLPPFPAFAQQMAHYALCCSSYFISISPRLAVAW
jgi:hypothetical protein